MINITNNEYKGKHSITFIIYTFGSIFILLQLLCHCLFAFYISHRFLCILKENDFHRSNLSFVFCFEPYAIYWLFINNHHIYMLSRAHTKAINSIEYVDDSSVVITASSDCAIRVWTLSGEYIGTFGETWKPLSDKTLKKQALNDFRLPKDLRRVASARTFRVLNHGTFPRWRLAIQRIREQGLEKILSQYEPVIPREEDPKKDEETEVKLQSSDILGKSYKRKIRHRLPKPHPKIIETATSVCICS